MDHCPWLQVSSSNSNWLGGRWSPGCFAPFIMYSLNFSWTTPHTHSHCYLKEDRHYHKNPFNSISNHFHQLEMPMFIIIAPAKQHKNHDGTTKTWLFSPWKSQVQEGSFTEISQCGVPPSYKFIKPMNSLYIYIYTYIYIYIYIVVSWNRGTLKSSHLNGIFLLWTYHFWIPPFVEIYMII